MNAARFVLAAEVAARVSAAYAAYAARELRARCTERTNGILRYMRSCVDAVATFCV